MGLKEDADFARFVSMGAAGTAWVAVHLRERWGHQPIELERYAMANKVWKTKVKRLRLPDLVCARCGLRIESRAKSSLKIMLSHSDSPGRQWDAGGMRDCDLFAFLRADLSAFPPYVSKPAFFTTSALRKTVGEAKRSAPKAASEGSEVTLTWASWVPSRSGRFVEVDETNNIVCIWDDGRTTKYWQWRNWAEPRFVYVEPGSEVLGGETILAGIVEPAPNPVCPGDVWDLQEALESHDPVERYGAVKAAGGRGDLQAGLIALARNEGEDWRIRLEALGSLARGDPRAWTRRIAAICLDGIASDEHRMEAVFVLSEIPTREAGDALAAIAMPESTPAELRAAAAWGLGQGAHPRPELLLPLTVVADRFVALHAISALQDLPDTLVPTLIGWLEGDDDRAAVAAQLLRRHGRVDALLDACESRPKAKLRALRALGDLEPAFVRARAGQRLTPDLQMTLEPMWVGHGDWLRNEGKEGLEALDVQKVRFDPTHPRFDPTHPR